MKGKGIKNSQKHGGRSFSCHRAQTMPLLSPPPRDSEQARKRASFVTNPALPAETGALNPRSSVYIMQTKKAYDYFASPKLHLLNGKNVIRSQTGRQDGRCGKS
ncbi:jg26243 [Pararge aegeria aegeria]|uniref:Jg26243 protein n=1 Tax=Pararge aegeria aegeria TaxID=348720 RepID=A0A8S4QCL5_9NEOP|nr:jg26243 [Pararge aegeria aegeria]